MRKFTPAPWSYDPQASKNDGGVRAKSGFICFMSHVAKYSGQDERFYHETGESLANAYLITAAPELLDALESIKAAPLACTCAPPSEGNVDRCASCQIYSLATDAIAKARGES